jgi:hypothetical protein
MNALEAPSQDSAAKPRRFDYETYLLDRRYQSDPIGQLGRYAQANPRRQRWTSSALVRIFFLAGNREMCKAAVDSRREFDEARRMINSVCRAYLKANQGKRGSA